MHTCHATDCNVRVPPEMFMCKRHWFSLPKKMRDAIWSSYRSGQCDDWQISKDYSKAAKDAVAFIAKKEGKEPDIRIYDLLEPK